MRNSQLLFVLFLCGAIFAALAVAAPSPQNPATPQAQPGTARQTSRCQLTRRYRRKARTSLSARCTPRTHHASLLWRIRQSHFRHRRKDGHTEWAGCAGGDGKSDAENSVKHIEGVEKVINKIEVLPPSGVDERIRRQVYNSIFGYGPLFKYGNMAVPPIHIIVRNGRITLEGVVDSEIPTRTMPLCAPASCRVRLA